MTTGQDSIP